MPRPLRRATLAIYRFAREADDIADEGDATPAQRLDALAERGRALRRIESRQAPETELFRDLAAVVRTYRLPIALFHDLLSAFAQDVTKTRYATAAELDDYCRRSANPVGRLVLHLYGADGPTTFRWSDSICTALQLTNFWQDVASDWARRRIYIPAEHMSRFGVTEAAIAAQELSPCWRELMRFETHHTRALLESGRPLVRVLPLRLRLELSAVLAGAHRILDGIDAVDGDVFARRPRLQTRDWIAVALRTVCPARRHTSARLERSA
ncbi:MAG: squalene synthase HpnC [Pseudomonadota bacterium]|nr:squalene synthase HpnC [Pseudomonadota bacterium]